MIPEPYEFVLLALIAYRAWRLLAEDAILEKPRRKLVRLPYTWKEGDAFPKNYRTEWAIFFNCPWCLGAWVSLGTYIAYLATLGSWPDSVTDVAVGIGIWFALSATVGFQRSVLDPPEEE